MKELEDMTKMVEDDSVTVEQLRDMKMSHLIMRISVYSTEMSTFKTHPEEIKELEKSDPVAYDQLIKMYNSIGVNLTMACDELDQRFQ